MEIEFDPDTDKLDIAELITAKNKVHEELDRNKFNTISEAQMIQYK